MRTFLLFIFVNFSICSFGQHLTQSFSSSFPPSGWTIDGQPSNWSVAQSSNAGGTSPEAQFSWTPEFNGISRLISPSIDLTGFDALTLEFKHAIDHYSSTYTVGVATRSGSGAWNEVWSRTGVSIVETINISITNSDVGSSNFQFCFFFSGNSYNINYWYIDDVFLYTPLNIDLLTYSINIKPYIAQGNHEVSATIKNIGLQSISSLDIEYQINDESPFVESITSINVGTNQSFTHTFNQQWSALPGNQLITVKTTNINGSGDDDNPLNNTLSKTISVASGSVANLPLFESFTSSTCGPCYSFNTNTFTPFLNSHQGEYAIIKYQMNWPGSGDPYYTSEGGTRRTYYGVSAVPQLFTGGEPTPTSSSGLNNLFSSHSSKESFFSITASFTVWGNMVYPTIEVTPFVSISGLKLRAAIIERVTTGNKRSNGETEFHYVMMKMLPDAQGTTVDFTDGEPFSISFSQNMTNTFVEEMSDLSLVVFIQNDSTKEILQSTMVQPTTSIHSNSNTHFSIYPNPTKGFIQIRTNYQSKNITVEVFNGLGSIVYRNSFNNENEIIDLNINQPPGLYIVKITDYKGESTNHKLIIR